VFEDVFEERGSRDELGALHRRPLVSTRRPCLTAIRCAE
jgi:hypothetical protein